MPQAGLQILLVWRGIDRESELVLYASVAIAILNAVRNIYKIYAGARDSGAYLYDFISETLSLGVGHVPHIAAIRAGKDSAFDFSDVEPSVFMDTGYKGLRLICDAMVIGKTVSKIRFTTCEYDLSEVLDFGADSESQGDALATAIKIDLPTCAEEPEGKFLASVLEVHPTVKKVLVAIEDQTEKEHGRQCLEHRGLGDERDNGTEFISICEHASQVELLRTRSRVRSAGPSKPHTSYQEAAAHLMLAFLFHPTWSSFELRIPNGGALVLVRALVRALQQAKVQGPTLSLFRALQLCRGDVSIGAAPTRMSLNATGRAALIPFNSTTAALGLARDNRVQPSELGTPRRRVKTFHLLGGADVEDLLKDMNTLYLLDLCEDDALFSGASIPKIKLFRIQSDGDFVRDFVPTPAGLRIQNRLPLGTGQQSASKQLAIRGALVQHSQMQHPMGMTQQSVAQPTGHGMQVQHSLGMGQHSVALPTRQGMQGQPYSGMRQQSAELPTRQGMQMQNTPSIGQSATLPRMQGMQVQLYSGMGQQSAAMQTRQGMQVQHSSGMRQQPVAMQTRQGMQVQHSLGMRQQPAALPTRQGIQVQHSSGKRQQPAGLPTRQGMQIQQQQQMQHFQQRQMQQTQQQQQLQNWQINVANTNLPPPENLQQIRQPQEAQRRHLA